MLQSHASDTIYKKALPLPVMYWSLANSITCCFSLSFLFEDHLIFGCLRACMLVCEQQISGTVDTTAAKLCMHAHYVVQSNL